MRELVFAFFIVLLFVNLAVFVLVSFTPIVALSILTNLCLVAISYWVMRDQNNNAKVFMEMMELRAKLAKLKKED